MPDIPWLQDIQRAEEELRRERERFYYGHFDGVMPKDGNQMEDLEMAALGIEGPSKNKREELVLRGEEPTVMFDDLAHEVWVNHPNIITHGDTDGT